eukprot:CAMPEP_0197847668 /NCGR_PEP_ID=MMETSP1438-20131217/6714_1 /TAXON_ID=1461541 /ORGANISM="Pterosperma sp., Strain CCMP1384" /LENGTH=580 /DNA_ID=CAMNT_0043459657 /DNA_START=508 /DNA_END=2250 /DNA_ORIENTATION=+
MENEEAGWQKRADEAKEAGIQHTGEWRWTLNWDEITPLIIVGSCPRSVGDVDRLKHEAGVDAIMCLQSDACFDALKIDWPPIRQRAIQHDIAVSRIAVYDFDHGDQALMLPEAVRTLALHVSAGRRTYVHCTAGINRASLTVVGYFTFVMGMALEEAEQLVKSKRSQAHPYIDCWKTVHQRQLEGRSEELTAVSRDIYRDRCESGEVGTSYTDWKAAETFCIKRTFERRLKMDQMTTSSLLEIAEKRGNRLAEELEQAKSENAESAALLERVEAQLKTVEQEAADALSEAAEATGAFVRAEAQAEEMKLEVAESVSALARAEAEAAASAEVAKGLMGKLKSAEEESGEAMKDLNAKVKAAEQQATHAQEQLKTRSVKHEVEMLELQNQLDNTINSNAHYIKASLARAEAAEKKVGELEAHAQQLENELRALRMQRATTNGVMPQKVNGNNGHNLNGHIRLNDHDGNLGAAVSLNSYVESAPPNGSNGQAQGEPLEDPLVDYCLDNPKVDECELLFDTADTVDGDVQAVGAEDSIDAVDNNEIVNGVDVADDVGDVADADGVVHAVDSDDLGSTPANPSMD